MCRVENVCRGSADKRRNRPERKANKVIKNLIRFATSFGFYADLANLNSN